MEADERETACGPERERHGEPREYEAPRLIHLGSLAQITHSGGLQRVPDGSPGVRTSPSV
jgi:hypothetical protein